MEKKVIVLLTVIVLAIVVFVAMQMTGNAVVIQSDGTVKDAAFPALNPGEQAELDLDESIQPGTSGEVRVYCGDGICQVAEQGICVADCPVQNISTCGNGVCDESENYFSCAQDCSAENATCGDGVCDLNLNESAETCAADCDISEDENQTDYMLNGEVTQQNGGSSGGSATRSNTEISAVIKQLEERGVQVYLECDDSGKKVMIFDEPPTGYTEPQDCGDTYLGPTGRAAETTQTVRDYVFGRVVGGLFGL